MMLATVYPAERHEPVLVDVVRELFAGAPAGPIVDGTVGAGGHAAAIAVTRVAANGSAHLVGIDRDPVALSLADQRLAGVGGEVSYTLHRARFDEFGTILDDLAVGQVAGVMLDLGVSSMQLDEADRGFAHRLEGPLDMRMDPALNVTASDLVNQASVQELIHIFRAYGEERFAARVARAVVRERPIVTTGQLAAIVKTAVPAATRRSGGHPASRVFQALRIAVNGELEALERVLPLAIDRLMPGGVMVVLSYHSLEDRRVKQAFAAAAEGCVCPPNLPVCGCGRTPKIEYLVRRAVQADEVETQRNPRSRSVRLRAIRRLSEGSS